MDNVFTNQPSEAPQEPSQPQAQAQQPEPQNLFADKLAGIVNEKGEPKYKDVDSALTALNASQQFIPQLQSENAQLRAELEALKGQVANTKSIEETIKGLMGDTPSQEQPAAETPSASGVVLDESAILDLIAKQNQTMKAAETKQQNQAKVNEHLKSVYGDKAAEVVTAKATELGLTNERLGELASENPALVLNLFAQAPKTVQPTQTSFNSNAPTGKVELQKQNYAVGGAKMSDMIEFMRQCKPQ